MTRAGFPATIEFESTDFTTRAPVPMTQLSLISTPFNIVVLLPNQTLFPTTIDFEGKGVYRDTETGVWKKIYLVLVKNILYFFSSPMDIFNQIRPQRILDITNYSIRSAVVSSKSSCFEIAFNFEVYTISVKDDEMKSLWLIEKLNE